MKRNKIIKAVAAGMLAVSSLAHAALPVMEVYKSASCGCCIKWVEHLQANGFSVKVHNVDAPSDYRAKYGIPDELGSCHTAVVQGYAIEGHVPANEVKRLLKQKPKAAGLAVPAMPLGSPGMEGPRKDAYTVFLVGKDKKVSAYAKYQGS